MNLSLPETATQGQYVVNTPVFEGPLELLLYLIERAELDITKLSLAVVTDQFLDYFELLFEKNPQEVSAFLVVATKLLQIKSELLLPKPATLLDEEDPGEALTRQLREYKIFKTASEYLYKLGAMEMRTYLRLSPLVIISESLDLRGISVSDLRKLLLENLFAEVEINVVKQVEFHKVSIKEKLQFITNRLTHQSRIMFAGFFSGNDDWVDVVVTFLAVLELVKQRWISVSQENLFGDLVIETTEVFSGEFSLNLEFDD